MDIHKFDGTIVRSLMHKRGRFREFFQWIEPGTVDLVETLGPVVLDSYDFCDAPQLGPALIYARPLPSFALLSPKLFFSANAATAVHAELRARMRQNLDTVWPTDEQYVAGFRETYHGAYPARAVGGPDSDWWYAAQRSFQWTVVRAIVGQPSELSEVLVWMADRPRVWDEELLAQACEFLGGERLPVHNELIELFDTHVAWPSFGMIVFEIARNSKLSQVDYLQQFHGLTSESGD